jgi:transposase
VVNPDAFNSAIRGLPISPNGLPVVIEPVCGWLWVAEQLESAGMEVHIANPRKVRLIADSKMKCDRIDATTLAELLAVGYLPESYRAPKSIQEIRALVRERLYLVELQTGVKNRIQGVLTRRGLHALAYHPTSVRGAKAIAEGSDEEMKRSSQFLRDVALFIKPLDQQIETFAKGDTIAQLLMTMPGVGAITATTIVAEVGDFTRFASPKALASFAGIVPSQRSSGEKARFGHITKTGSKYLRHVLVEASYRIRASSSDTVGNKVVDPKKNTTPLIDFLDKRKKEHAASSARVALAHRMLTIMWHMVKNNTPYQPDFSLRTVK